MALLNLDDLYVGELITTEKKDCSNMIYIHDIMSNNIIYHIYFTIFKKDDFKYYCLEDNKEYSMLKNDNCYCINMTPFKQYLPKKDYSMPKKVSSHFAKHVFDILFGKNNFKKAFKLSKKNLYSQSDYYVGNLKLCYGVTDETGDYKFISLPEKLMLDKTATYKENTSVLNNKIYDYYNYYCVFTKTDSGYLNLCDNQKYTDDEAIGKSYITNINTLPSYLRLNKYKATEMINNKNAICFIKRKNACFHKPI